MVDLDDKLEDFRDAGRIAAKVREEARKVVIPGQRYLDIVETLEEMIVSEGARPAFPVNISVNSIAAHYTPEYNSEEEIGEDDLVKIDLGAEVNWAVSDTAITLDLSDSRQDLVSAPIRALEKAISVCKAGVTIGELGSVIESEIRSAGFKPVANLTGHKIERGVLHAGIDIPNIKTDDPYELQAGEIYAIEPFASTGSGFVSDLDQCEIFSLASVLGNVRMRTSRKIYMYILENRRLLPFSERWLMSSFKSRLTVAASLKEMVRERILEAYPVLKDSGDGLVSQAEHTVLITDNGCEVLTK